MTDTSIPAFPVPHCLGMTLRDYFAAAALQGVISAAYECGCQAPDVAKEAYDAADAMIAEREK